MVDDPPLGEEKALEEILGNGGNMYDRRVVEACLALFKEGDFDLHGHENGEMK